LGAFLKPEFMETKNTNSKSPRESISGWENILQHHGMTQETFEAMCATRRPHEVGTLECEMIIAAYNGRQLEDPLPTWGPNTDPKGQAIYNMPQGSPSGAGFSLYGHGRWRASSDVGARLVFTGPEWSENLYDAHEKFLPQFERMITL
jgi:hypothetical protein